MRPLARWRGFASQNVHHGDAFDELAKLDPLSVDLILTDPPFFMPATHYQSRAEWAASWTDTSPLQVWFKEFLVLAKRAIKPSGHLLCFCDAKALAVFLPPAFELWDRTNTLVWDKGKPGLGKVWRKQHELILHATNSGSWMPGDGLLVNDCLVAQNGISSNPTSGIISKGDQSSTM